MKSRPRRPSAEDRLEAELRDHVERYVADRIAEGMSEAQARRQARVELGGLEQAKEACRDVRPWQWLGEFTRDVRHGIRSMRREPFFAAAVTGILALGIGTSVAMFSVLHAVVLRPLPYARPNWRRCPHTSCSRTGRTAPRWPTCSTGGSRAGRSRA